MLKASKRKSNLSERLVPPLFLATIALSFVTGMLYEKVSSLTRALGTSTALGGSQQAQGDTRTTTTDQGGNTSAGTISKDKLKEIFNSDVIKFGKADAKIIFLEVADPSCPFCHIAGGLNPQLNAQVGDRFKLVSDGGTYVAPVPEMKKLVDSGKAAFVWIYTPGHGNGEIATEAFYCAYEKGKFWQVHDKIMTNEGYNLVNNVVKNDKSKSKELADFLSGVIDPGFLKSCIDSGKYDERLKKESDLARSIGITGTPGFYINDKIFRGAYSFSDMESVVNQELSKG